MPVTISPNAANSAELLNQLRSLLTNQLGTFANKRAAIWAEPQQSPTVGTGLHVYIDRTFQRLTRNTYQIRVTLVMHGSREQDPIGYEQNLQRFDAAIRRIRAKFPRHREINIPFREDLPPQFRFLLLFEEADAI